MESANLLLIEGREVAKDGVRSENPGIELEPHEIDQLISEDPETWKQLVGDLYDVSLVMLQAIDERDADKLFDNGGPLDQSCERCHRQYWYPDSIERPTEGGPASIDQGSEPTTAELIPGGRIEGRIRLSGKPPGNRVIRMGLDPKCKDLREGETVIQEAAMTSADGGLGNVFVRLLDEFPETPVPAEPVVIDQRGCIFTPRVVGARVGQALEIRNSDPLLHTVRALSATTNDFNLSQALQGMVSTVQLEPEGGEMLRIKCDVHRWMTEYIGVVEHPYFAVSDLSGGFAIDGVPPGNRTLQAWHEVYGLLGETVVVAADSTSQVELTYSGETG